MAFHGMAQKTHKNDNRHMNTSADVSKFQIFYFSHWLGSLISAFTTTILEQPNPHKNQFCRFGRSKGILLLCIFYITKKYKILL
jgi:hypothetical protein